MCGICHQVPCNPRCPNANDEETTFCRCCGGAVERGFGIIINNGVVFCDECFIKMTNDELMDYLGIDYEDF